MTMTFQAGHTLNAGRKQSEETKKKISAANKGRKFSDEWRKNLSIAHKGQVSWRKGKKFVDEKEQKEKRKAYLKAWRKKNKDRIAEVSRERAKKNGERRRLQARIRYRKNPQRELDLIRFNKYGITGEEFRVIVGKQENKCPICAQSVSKNYSVDHDHVTGKVRGIICNDCNLAIANANDSPKRLRAMANYLEKII